MPTNGDTQSGIRLILEEFRDLRVELAGDRKQAAEDRKQAAEDRRRSDERAAEDRRRFETMMRDFAQDAARRERNMSRALVVIGTVGRRILQTQQEHTKLLKGILRTLSVRGNGQGGNGAKRRTT